MHNAPKPRIEDLPTHAQLRRSAIVAAIGAAVIGVGVTMPAEFGRDPTGLGDVLGLTEMGEIKQELTAEAAADAAIHGTDQSSSLMDGVLGLFASAAHAQEATAWRDEVVFTLEPGASTEVKLTLEAGDAVAYAWSATGGRINYDLHAHGGGESIDYEKGRGETEGEGSFEAPFAGDHGWFWRNRDDAAITVTLNLGGDYGEILPRE